MYTSQWICTTILRNGANPAAFDVASNPEFLHEGTAITDFLYPDRIVVEVESEQCAAVLRAIYQPLTSGGLAVSNVKRLLDFVAGTGIKFNPNNGKEGRKRSPCCYLGQFGGNARKRKLTREQRRQIARKAAQARWAKNNQAEARREVTGQENLNSTSEQFPCFRSLAEKAVCAHQGLGSVTSRKCSGIKGGVLGNSPIPLQNDGHSKPQSLNPAIATITNDV